MIRYSTTKLKREERGKNEGKAEGRQSEINSQ
jgi:hypothetical protein